MDGWVFQPNLKNLEARFCCAYLYKKNIIIIHLYLLSILTYLIMGYLLRVALCGIVLLRK